MPPIIGRRPEEKIDRRGQQHADGDVFVRVAVVGEIAHHKFAQALGHGTAGQNVADRGRVVTKRFAEFPGDGREIITDDANRCVGDERGLEDAPTVKGDKIVPPQLEAAGVCAAQA